LKVSPTYLLVLHASQIFSRIINRLAAEEVPVNEIEGRAFSELKRVFGTNQDIQYLVDYKVRQTLMDNYKKVMKKALDLPRVNTDDYATILILSDLSDRKQDEIEFSEWLHNEPLHVTSPQEEEEVQQMLEDQEEEENPQQEEEPQPDADETESNAESEGTGGGGSEE
jgi:hypothetical protein